MHAYTHVGYIHAQGHVPRRMHLHTSLDRCICLYIDLYAAVYIRVDTDGEARVYAPLKRSPADELSPAFELMGEMYTCLGTCLRACMSSCSDACLPTCLHTTLHTRPADISAHISATSLLICLCTCPHTSLSTRPHTYRHTG